MVFHPDKRPGDKLSEAEFKNIVMAFEILGDPEARALYDKGRIDAQGRPVSAENANGFHEYHGREAGSGWTKSAAEKSKAGFKDAKRGGARVKRADKSREKQYRLAIGFVEACLGTVKRVRLPNGQELKISIPAGVDNGQRLRVNGAQADGLQFVVKVSVEPHMLFKRRGSDICIEVPITPYEACFGAEFEIPSVHGPLKINVPRGAKPTEEMRITGFGIRRKGQHFGDLIVHYKIALPDHWPDAAKQALKMWRETASYNPRSRIRRVLAR